MARRWPVALIGLLCTVCALYLVHKRPIAYQACGSVIVTAPKSSAENVYNAPQGSLTIVTGLVARQLDSQQVQSQLQAKGLTAAYQAQLLNNGTPEAPQYNEPLANICASSYDLELTLRTAIGAIQEFATILRERQLENATPREFITDSVVIPPVPLPVTGRPAQAYLGVAAIGITLTSACYVWTGWLLRLRAQRGGGAGRDGTRKRLLGVARARRAEAAGRLGGN